MILPGSYSNGFAPRDGQPLYPELWRGCVGAWNPGLGPTGLTLRDSSGFGNHGTFTNLAATAWATNESKYSLGFVSSTNQSIQVPSASGQLSTPPKAVSVACWCRPTLAGTIVGREIVSKFHGASAPYVSYGLQYHNTTVDSRFSFAIGGTTGGDNGYNFLEAASASALNVWHHVCGTYDGTTMRMYVNGLQSSTFAISTDIIFTAQPLAIGRWLGNANTTESLVGQVDDVRVYRNVLIPNEIRLLAARRGIAYELAPRKRSRISLAGFQPYWLARKTQIIGGGF